MICISIRGIVVVGVSAIRPVSGRKKVFLSWLALSRWSLHDRLCCHFVALYGAADLERPTERLINNYEKKTVLDI